MSAVPAGPRTTPFHIRAAGANRGNDWLLRNGITLSRVYATVRDEALAMRLRVGLVDVSWRWRVLFEGARAGEFLDRLVTRAVTTLAPGGTVKVLWLDDDGGVRGAGVIARFGRARFYLVAPASDSAWIGRAAARFGVSVRDISDRYGGLAVVGPYAAATLARAGLDPKLAALSFRRQNWGGLDVTLSRWGDFAGYEIWCGADDGLAVWDRLMAAGAAFGIVPVGTAAADLADIEGGIVRPGLDYVVAGRRAAPSARALGLEGLIDEAHTVFNGRPGWHAARLGERRRLVGIIFDGETPVLHAPLLRKGVVVDRTLTSAFSPALQRAIALASVDVEAATPGTALFVTPPASLSRPESLAVTATVCELPFLPPPSAASLPSV